jgi:hypothetical protein
MPRQPNYIAQICVNFVRFATAPGPRRRAAEVIIDHDDPAKLTRTIGESVPATMQQRIGDRLMDVDEGASVPNRRPAASTARPRSRCQST